MFSKLDDKMCLVPTEKFIENLFLIEPNWLFDPISQHHLMPRKFAPSNVREESLLQDIQPDELHVKFQDPNFMEEAQLIDVREPEEVYAPIFLNFN